MREKLKNENENTDSSGSLKGLPISGRYLEFARRALPEKLREELQLAAGATYADGLVAVLFDAALKGNPHALREIRESLKARRASAGIQRDHRNSRFS
jgi:hypothetical protein